VDSAWCYHEQAIYRIRVRGIVGEQSSEWLAVLTITPQADGATLLVGPLRDQAALHGLLSKLCGTGLLLLSVRRTSGHALCQTVVPVWR